MILRSLAVLVLLGLLGFCAFGLLATFELTDGSALPWRLGYGGVAVVILVLIWRLLTKQKRHNEREGT